MPSPLSDDDVEAPERSLSARVATLLERMCFLSVRVAIPGMVVIGGAFLLYVVGGAIATTSGL